MLLFAVALLLAPTEPVPPFDCATVTVASASAADAPAPMFVPPAMQEELLLASLGDEYVRCLLDSGEVSRLLVLQGDVAVATLRDGRQLEFALPPEDASQFVAAFAARGVEVSPGEAPPLTLPDSTSAAAPRDSGSPLLWLLAFASIATGAALLYRRRRRPRKALVHRTASQSSPLRATSRSAGEDVPSTRFSDVAGHAEAVEDLAEMVDVLRNPEKYRDLGARPPRGALLVGPPGTGKTLLARAVAGEAGVPFYAAAGSDFVELYVGVGARRVRDVFERAKKAERAIVFIDEIDAVGRRRSPHVSSGGDQEMENTLVALLNELDGFAATNVLVLAATNRPDVLDPALTRPGRLDRKIHVGLPDEAARLGILGVHTRSKRLDSAVDLSAIARRTPGMSGAQLEQVCNEAALLAARRGASSLAAGDFSAAVEYVLLGRARRSATVAENDRIVAAWHEAGHALVAHRHPHAPSPIAVSITPRGNAGGVTWMSGDESQILSRQQLRARLAVALAGRAAEERLLGGEHTAGAADDLLRATEIASAMVQRFGMSDFGLAVRGDSQESDLAVDRLLRAAHDEAVAMLESNADALRRLAEALLEHEDLDAEGLAVLLD